MNSYINVNSSKKIALVHDWLVSNGGGERVLYDMHLMFPNAPIYTLVYDKQRAPKWLSKCDVRTTYIQRIPFSTYLYKNMLSLMPNAWENLDLTQYDLVLSSCSSCCKGVIVSPDALHVCYCHSPIRYAWDMYYSYLENANSIKKPIIKHLMHSLREWDYIAAQRVDYFISNSHFVGKRIEKYYKRNSTTIYPSTQLRSKTTVQAGEYYLIVSRYVRYKRIDLAIEACNALHKDLKIVGSGGEEEKYLKSIAGPTIEFLGHLTDEELSSVYAKAKAFLFPGMEDFGLTPIEAMSFGVPVIAYAAGGALETVVNDKTGLFFESQTVDSLIDALKRFESDGVDWNRKQISEYTDKFDSGVFRSNIYHYLLKIGAL